MSEPYLQRLVSVMDQLRSPGGCIWDAEQSHETLLKFLLEESYEYIEAVESGDREGMQEELGDLLLQVYFHARMAQEHPTEPFTIEDVAQSVVEKLIRRHPHVFGDVKVSSSEEVLENWEALKALEKGRTSAVDGVPLAQPALALVGKLLYRAEKNKIELTIPTWPNLPEDADEKKVGEILLATIAWAQKQGIDPESALRGVSRNLISEIVEFEKR